MAEFQAGPFDCSYMPVLKGKQGEFQALGVLSDADKAAIIPMVEVVEVPWDWENDVAAKSLDDHLDSFIAQLSAVRPAPLATLVDPLFDVAPGATPHPVDRLFDGLRAHGARALPVVTLSADADFRSAAARAAAADAWGAAIRLELDETNDPNFAGALAQLVGDIGLTVPDVHMILDLGALCGTPAAGLAYAALAGLHLIPQLSDWATVTVTFSAFPPDLSGVPTGTTARLARDDALAWRQLVGTLNPSRTPCYGDYAADNPQHVNLDPRIIRPAASIRYTDDDEWLIARGHVLRGRGGVEYGQYQALAAQVAGDAGYRGAAFSDGDQTIETCATGGPTGNLTTWRRVATNHHLALVIWRIANHGEP